MSSPSPYAPDRGELPPRFLRNGSDEIQRDVDRLRTENPAALAAIEQALKTKTQGELSDEQYVADALDRLNHRKMKKIATEMLAGRDEKPMTVIELADVLAEWADKNRSDRDG